VSYGKIVGTTECITL